MVTRLRENPDRCGARVIRLVCALTLLCVRTLPAQADTIFDYPAITSPIVSASFSGDFAALTAHRTLAGFEVNALRLVDLTSTAEDADLSSALFGETEAFVDPALIDQGALGTGLVLVDIPSTFFAALAGGRIGVAATLTDTADGLFAIDFLALTIDTTAGSTIALLDANDGFGIGLPDGASLPNPLPFSIPIDATGTGFDEAVSSVSLEPKVSPEPGTVALMLAASSGLLLRRHWWASPR